MDEAAAKKIIRQLFQAINYLHNINIVHRDIKLENILIEDESFNIKLADFGFASVFDGNNLNETVGSPIFMPPEIIQKKNYDSKVDIWSAGVVTYFILTGKPPFIEVNSQTTKSMTYHSILHCQLNLNGSDFEHLSPDLKDFLTKTLDKNPKTRLTVKAALTHAWLCDPDPLQ